MEIILKEDIANLGFKNDIVKVRDGYGRNFLIPQKKAVIATPSARSMLAEELKQRAHKMEKIKSDMVALATSLEGVTLTVAAKASESGKIFGAVNTIILADAFVKAGFNIDRKNIVVKEAVKELGNYSCTLKLHKEVTVEVPFVVVAAE